MYQFLKVLDATFAREHKLAVIDDARIQAALH
jgi:hypothetical protein